MAIAGAMTTAYSLTPGKGTRPNVEHTTFPSDRCTPPDVAVRLLRERALTANAMPVIVQGSDMSAFWAAWEGGE
jgi:hypothetical protein